ncbi:MAG TPA: chromosome segregation protein SMC [Steroidobacteraceae bacterium]|jgi:chromosome segregation protein|nr:chromosome segregation protein SMC [Steroidobacteraceae bacterium]
MRLHRIKLAGFKSFVDPTSVHLPGNLTGVVGPNGCGKSNIIDAVRWVMGELSARYLRGDSMADVIFNGSSARKSVGTASVELVFDNADGRIGGAYASYSEISLKRVVERDGTSGYFINGGRCRRRDITALFLGTGLGSRSYAIIEQGMISRVIEARADDMRAFIEEAAGISLYKERRRETESRIADTRENLSRLNDLREEVDKQIRHLQRQAGAARRYQEYKTRERNLTAELLALRLRELDAAAVEQDRSVRECELSMQQALADQRAAEAGIDKQREFYAELSTALSQVQGRYYEFGAQVTRTEESIRHGRELRERARSELAQIGQGLGSVTGQIARDEQQLSALRAQIAELAPLLESRRAEEQRAAGALSQLETGLSGWQQRWEGFNRELGTAGQSAQVEAARIEQLESQRHRLQAQADRLSLESDALAAQADEGALGGLTEREAQGRSLADTLAQQLSDALSQVQQLRAAQQGADGRLERLRHEREQARSELISLEALQKAALREKNPRTGAWLAALPAAANRPRLAEMLEVEAGWERAVETVLGDYLEAIGIDGLEQLEQALPQLPTGQLTFFEAAAGPPAGPPAVESSGAAVAGTLAAQVRGPAPVATLLGHVHTAASLADALRRRAALPDGDSLITPTGEWLGRGWLRVNRGGDVHAGVLEREQRLKVLRERCSLVDARVGELEREIVAVRAQVSGAEQHRDRLQGRIQQAQREHAELRSQLEAHRARIEQAALRRQRIEAEQSEVALDVERTRESLDKARTAYDSATQSLALLDEQRRTLEEERELRREQTAQARARAHTAQLELRDAMVRLEGRRSGEGSMSEALQRLLQQRESLQRRQQELEGTMAQAAEPLAQLERDLQEHLARRQEAEAELAGARRSLEDGERELRTLEQRRLAAEQRVSAARTAMEQARLAAQESRLRREALMEQFAATQCELPAVLESLDPDAQPDAIEQRLTAVRADLERLGQVNLAAIGELAEQGERKSYLDRQFADVSDALQTLEQAMRKIDRETRTRFEDTFNRINAGLQEKFPRLFGGGHAYLELIGEDPLTAGVAVMARPPGKRNSTISQLSGGEKALTAVALVFAIFDLNPAPFCLLDEVDAPLDESNIGRFCDIVRDMSSRVQFIFITHSRLTMELASQLIGVTMSEPGVSRLVTVDIDEAVKLAAV